jgi:hypothetical protein
MGNRTANHYATATRQLPFYRMQLTSTSTDRSDSFLDDVAQSPPIALLSIPKYGFELYSIMHKLQRLGLATSKPWIDNVDRMAFSNMMHEAEYEMLTLSWHLTTVTGRIEEQHEIGAHAIAEALVAAAQAFGYAALRQLPLPMRIFDLYLQRLHTALDRDDVEEIWMNHASLDALLFAMAMATVTAEGRPLRVWVIRKLDGILMALGIWDFEELESRLRAFAWSDVCAGYVEGAWKDVLKTRV